MKLDFNPRYTPAYWMATIIASADPFSAVIPSLVYATFRKRFPGHPIGERATIPAAQRTPSINSFVMGQSVHHVTAASSVAVLQQCAADRAADRWPILMVPEGKLDHAKRHARLARLHEQISFFSLESFFAFKIIMMACDEARDAYDIFSDIIKLYNQRLVAIKADLSHTIQLN